MSEIFKNDDKLYERRKKLITLSPELHMGWQLALFALKLISFSPHGNPNIQEEWSIFRKSRVRDG